MLKSEIDQLSELLNSDSFATVEDLAKAVYQKSVDMYVSRDLWVFRAGDQGYGPYMNKPQAKAGAKFFGLDETSVKTLLSASRLVYSDTSIDVGVLCNECHHPKFSHFPKTKANQTAWGCLVKEGKVQCTCQQAYKERKV